MAVAANAQTTGGVEDNPYYTAYMAAVENLGDIVSPRPWDSRIAPATVALVQPTTRKEVGSLAGIKGQHLREALVVPDLDTFDAMNDGFTMSYLTEIGDNQAALNNYVDIYSGQQVGFMDVINKTSPTLADISALPPFAADADYVLHAFTLTQSSVVVGWLLREEFHHDNGSVSYCDRYYYMWNYKAIKKDINPVTAVPMNPGFSTHQDFLETLPVNQLFRYQHSTYYELELIP